MSLDNRYKIKEEHLELLKDALLLIRDNKPVKDAQAANILYKLCPPSLRYYPYSDNKPDAFMKDKFHIRAERNIENAIKLNAILRVRSTTKLKYKYYHNIAGALAKIT